MGRIVRIRELSQHLGGVSVHTLYKKVSAGEIPFRRLGNGRTLFFDLDEIDSHMRRQGDGDAAQLSEPTSEEQAVEIAGEILASV